MSELAPYGHQVGERLGGMLVSAVSCVYHRNQVELNASCGAFSLGCLMAITSAYLLTTFRVSATVSPLTAEQLAPSEKTYYTSTEPQHRGLKAEPSSGAWFEKQGGEYLALCLFLKFGWIGYYGFAQPEDVFILFERKVSRVHQMFQFRHGDHPAA